MLVHLQSFIASVAPFFILLGILIFVHELGHFLVAKFYGVRVETFSLGFGKKLLSYKYGDTVYCISLIPLGGYVKMYGDDPNADIPLAERTYSFLHKPVGQRVAIVLAGPLVNLFFAAFLFIAIAGIGEEVPGPYLGDLTETSKAYTAGFRSGDKIMRIGETDTPTWAAVKEIVQASGGQTLAVLVDRKGEAVTVNAEATVGENENIFSTNRQIGRIEGLIQESRSTVVGVKNNSPAALAGLKPLDLIASVNGEKVTYWRDLPALLAKHSATGVPLKLEVRSLLTQSQGSKDGVRTLTIATAADLHAQTDVIGELGIEPAELYIFQIKKDSPANKGGLQVKDRVTRINGFDVSTWSDVLNKVKAFDTASDGMDFTILRDGTEKTVRIKPEMTSIMDPSTGREEKRFTIGIVSGFFPVGAEAVFYRNTAPLRILGAGLKETANWTELVAMSLVRLVQGDVSAKNLGGVITIGRVASHSFEAGLNTFLRTMAIISINLFLLNLLPVPVLDGGHLVFYAIEALRGAPLSLRKMEIAQQIGLMLLMFLMVFALFNDITNLLYNRW